MKAERLLSLMILLANHGRVAAPELAKRYGVSQRTIYRDVAALSAAGVPVVTEPGRTGGISLLPGYRLDGAVVKPAELGHVLAGLDGLATAVPDPELRETAEKFRALGRRPGPLGLHMELSPAPRDGAAIETIRQAAALGRLLALDYAGTGRAPTRRSVEPYALVFLWGGWHLWGWCRLRGDWRLFKLARITGIALQPERFQSREPDLASRPWLREWEGGDTQTVRLLFHQGAAVAARERFGDERLEPQADGSLLLILDFPINDWLVSSVAGFGGAVRVLDPPILRQRLLEHARAILSANAEVFSENPDRS